MSNQRTPRRPTKKTQVVVSRELVERTVSMLLQMQAAQSYALIREWDRIIPDLLVPVPLNGSAPTGDTED